MGFLDFLFSNVVTNNQKKALRNNRSKTISNHGNYYRGYEDGYDNCCSDHDNSFDEHPVDGYCEHKIMKNMISMTVTTTNATGDRLGPIELFTL